MVFITCRKPGASRASGFFAAYFEELISENLRESRNRVRQDTWSYAKSVFSARLSVVAHNLSPSHWLSRYLSERYRAGFVSINWPNEEGNGLSCSMCIPLISPYNYNIAMGSLSAFSSGWWIGFNWDLLRSTQHSVSILCAGELPMGNGVGLG